MVRAKKLFERNILLNDGELLATIQVVWRTLAVRVTPGGNQLFSMRYRALGTIISTAVCIRSIFLFLCIVSFQDVNDHGTPHLPILFSLSNACLVKILPGYCSVITFAKAR